MFRHVFPAFCLGVIAIFFMPAQGEMWAIIAAVLALLIGLFCWKMNRLMMFAIGLTTMLLGAGYGYLRTEHALSKQWTTDAQSQEFHIQITGLPEVSTDGRTRFMARATAADGRQYRLQFQDYTPRVWQVGEHWRVKARVRAPMGTRNVVGFDREAWALANGVDGIASLSKTRVRLPETSWAGLNGIRARVVQHWQAASKAYPQGAALMKALSVGDDSGLSVETWAAFRPLGLNHLISISGLHITMMAVMAAWLAQKMMRFTKTPRRPRLYALAVGWLVAAIYTGLAGFEIPALRSLLMLSVFAAAWAWRGAWSSWQIWWAAMAAVLLYQPMAVLAVGFWLSFGLVAALLWALAFRLPEMGQRSFWRHRIIVLKQAVIGQWAATLVGGVATIYLFGLLPIFSPLVNAVAIPLFSWLLTPVALLASALPIPALKMLAAWLGEQTIQLLIKLGTWLPESAFAHAPTPLFWLAVVAAMILLLPNGLRLKPFALISLTAFALYQPPPFSGSLKATVWDVGQGLSVLIQTPTQNILYDTGTPAAELALLPNLRAANVRQLDTLILSHHDDDHDGGYPILKKTLPIKQLYAGQPEFYPHAQACRAGTQWTADGVLFQFLNLPPNTQQTLKDNDLSCVLHISAHGQALLITGDISQPIENQLIEQYGEKLKSNVFILAHHGSKSSNSSAFLRAVSPQAAVASSGFANAYRHPAADVQRRLAALHIQLLRTDLQGGLEFHFTPQGVTYKPLASQPLWWQRKPFALSK